MRNRNPVRSNFEAVQIDLVLPAWRDMRVTLGLISPLFLNLVGTRARHVVRNGG